MTHPRVCALLLMLALMLLMGQLPDQTMTV